MILVFGGNGQLGQELSRKAIEHGAALTALPRSEADITNADQVKAAIQRHKPDVVVNAAAYTAVDQAEDEYDIALRANAHGPAILAAACRSADIPLIHISTDYVFDGKKAGAYRETDAIAPIGAYGRSKVAGEIAVRVGMPKHLIIRTSWIYGEFGKNFLKTILRLARERDELRIVADQHGNPTSTAALASAILSIAPQLQNENTRWGTYHFCGTGVTSWHGFAEWIVAVQARHTNRKPKVLPITTQEYPTRAARPENSALDCTLIRHVFGTTAEAWTKDSERVTDALLRA
ncbi:dTDP-4-dehydrorhamnose reductase [Pseudorhodoplanes sinuspersici]|uniref:dTDP-4-dehydrorhamnose reductase n=1 Tax=Pseudorhodoplanes sinuspersici TaxID=1235591 RepID=A0A1W6ZYE7_9HYPH|nr:dTDP-4-dehydrorhamnose reductase [Pseudorhodoplanes sinuspersici]ARQ02308.1 dTDP-4-dehydrorhamnose reductase [Pseudorhodoplanes sinuspersici]RKE74137.1 dTDP-4-dehydrorhamnose reductase [Pseudorhodoplanes sinuspersici]